jgi:Fe2+ or Zn2+ uptake regulation protein
MKKSANQKLKQTGLRVTRQRSAILDIIRQGHLDADEIYRRTREKGYNLSLSTVYRALKKFKEARLVEELHFDDAHHHYEATPVQEHHHLVCLGCGKVIEFKLPSSHHIEKNLPEAKGFAITGTEIRVTGYCPRCKNK